MIKHIISLTMVLILLLAVGCSSSTSTECGKIGTLILKLIDAPADSVNITGVYIAINEIQVNNTSGNGDANWKTVKEYTEPAKFDLLELTGGEVALLGEFDLTAGKYNQIRFNFDLFTCQSVNTHDNYLLSFAIYLSYFSTQIHDFFLFHGALIEFFIAFTSSANVNVKYECLALGVRMFV